MGWRADKTYEEAQARNFREWRASLTWRAYRSWQWSRHQHFFGGVAAGGIVMVAIWWLTKT
jgi:hypothetical protein